MKVIKKWLQGIWTLALVALFFFILYLIGNISNIGLIVMWFVLIFFLPWLVGRANFGKD
jgi:hypothetical protein